MDNNELENFRRDVLLLKRAQINLENCIQEDKDKKSKQELTTCLQELARYKEVLKQNKNSLAEKSKSCLACEEDIGKLKDELTNLKKIVKTIKQDKTSLEKKDKNNDRCQDESVFNEIKNALQEKCKRLYKEELENLKKTNKESNDDNGDDVQRKTNYQEAILALLNKLLEQKKKDAKVKPKDDKGNNRDNNDKGNENEFDNKVKPEEKEGFGNDDEDCCLKRLEEFKKAVKDIDTSNDTVNIKLQNLKKLFTKLEKETEIPPPDQNSLAFFH